MQWILLIIMLYFIWKKIIPVINYYYWLVSKEPQLRNSKDIRNLPGDWSFRRQHTLRKFNYTCSNCGGKYKSQKNLLHVHHKIMKTKGGSHGFDNLVLLCKNCHVDSHPFWKRRELENELLKIQERIEFIRFNNTKNTHQDIKKLYEKELMILGNKMKNIKKLLIPVKIREIQGLQSDILKRLKQK